MFANGTKGVSLHDSNTVLAGLVANAGNSVYANNALQYHTPRFAGFQVQVEYAPSELAGADAGMGLAVRYDAGPLSASVTNYTGAGTAGSPATLSPKSVTQLAAAYDFKVAKVFFTYRDDGNKATTADTGYALGVTAPVGPGAIYASYNVIEQATNDGRTIIAGYKYNLSKRTQAYVNVARRNAAYLNAAAPSPLNGSTTGYGFGLQHNF
jgi:predicted porin